MATVDLDELAREMAALARKLVGALDFTTDTGMSIAFDDAMAEAMAAVFETRILRRDQVIVLTLLITCLCRISVQFAATIGQLPIVRRGPDGEVLGPSEESALALMLAALEEAGVTL